MINQHFLSVIFIIEPHVSVSTEEQIDRDVTRQWVERRLSEACNDGTFTLDGNDFWEETLRRIDGWVIDLKDRTFVNDVPDVNDVNDVTDKLIILTRQQFVTKWFIFGAR